MPAKTKTKLARKIRRGDVLVDTKHQPPRELQVMSSYYDEQGVVIEVVWPSKKQRVRLVFDLDRRVRVKS